MLSLSQTSDAFPYTSDTSGPAFACPLTRRALRGSLMELKVPLGPKKVGYPTHAKTCRCDRPWANYNESPTTCVKCGRRVEKA